jgi:hypothetical protein
MIRYCLYVEILFYDSYNYVDTKINEIGVEETKAESERE